MWLINMSWSWALVIFCRSRVTGKKSAKFVVSQNQCFGETLKVHTLNKDSLTPEGFSRYWPRSFGKVQGQWNEKCKIYVQSITKIFFMENHWKSSPCKEIAFEFEVVPLCRVCLKTVEVSRSHTDEGSDEIDFYLEKNDFFTWIWNLLFASPFVGKRNPSKFRKTSKSIFFRIVMRNSNIQGHLLLFTRVA